MEPTHLPLMIRPRERLLVFGAHQLATEELLAVLLGTGMRGRPAIVVARDLLAETGNLVALSRASPRELARVPGVGAARATRMSAAFDLGRRAMREAALLGAGIASARDIYERLRASLCGLSQEVFIVLALDARSVVLEEIEVARGWLTGVEVHPREVFRPLIRAGAAAAVIAHNHPSGDPQPSAQDILLTARLREVAELVGIPLLDHVIIAGRGYVSMAETQWT
jgi:DNA repair protein RadC